MIESQPNMDAAYGEEARLLLGPLQTDIPILAQHVAEEFYDYLYDQAGTAEIISRMVAEEFRRLRHKQSQYFAMLMSDELTCSEHMQKAHKTGFVHALAGIDEVWIIEAYRFYLDKLYELLEKVVPDTKLRHATIHLMSHRFLIDMEVQISMRNDIAAAVETAFSRLDTVVMTVGNLTDLVRGALEIIGTLPGGVSVFFARVDEAGMLQIEQSYGDAAEQYHRAMEAGFAPKLSIDQTIPAGQGPGGRSWRSGDVVITDAWQLQSDLAPWQELGEVLGFRSNASVPLLNETGHSIALMSLYSGWPGYFSTGNIRGFLNHLQQVLSHGVQQRIHAPVVALREQQTYRALLSEGRVVMRYQPVIHLRDGSLAKIEGLARLRDQDGELISPQRFLPALGREELLKLFELGLTQICQDLRSLQDQGLDTQVAINLPAEGLDDPSYEQTFFDCVLASDLKPDRFQIEVLETREAGERTTLHKAFIQRLQAAGAQIAQDDLGSGHSSLLRLDQYPFDEVKIDQGLVRGGLHNPKRAVDFILHLTSLAHAFAIPVTVEGLENEGMIEAAAILGADRGQGYGIARPMPVDQLPEWHQTYTYTVDSRKPRTAMGALAGYMLWDMQLATISERPELVSEFIGAKAMIEQFINSNKLHESTLEQLLTRSLESVASSGRRSEASTILRAQLIKELTDYWLSEVAGGD